MNVNSRFVPFVRQSTFSGDALTIRAAGRPVNVPVSRYGPGDVIGIDAAQISRRDPAPGSLSMPPNLFPSLEFSRADLPWALTPGPPEATGRLRPWLALITVEATGDSPLANIADAKLPVIEVPQDALPAATEIALWAHVQVDASVPPTEDVFRRGIARILSPRALEPKTRYLCCLVPAFEAGRLAGLGQTVPDPRSTAPAWTGGPGTVVLPVYDSWFFTTADSEDLETIAQRLQGVDLSASSRPKQLDVSSVSGNVAGKLAPFEGALRPVGTSPPWTGAAVTSAAKVLGSQLEHAPVGGVPVVGPPVYGSIASGQNKPAPGWLNDLNLDPRWRAAAGLGSTGKIAGRASIPVPNDHGFLSAADTSKFLTLMRNLPRTDSYTIAPRDLSWFAIFDFDAAGYVKDDEKIDANVVLQALREGNARGNEERRRRGFPSLEIEGWFVPPHYDDQTKRLEWATRLKSEQGDVSVNYKIRLLGRAGVMSAVLVSDPDSLDKDIRAFKLILNDFSFDAGERYSEFRVGDKVAEYGLTGLIVGGAAAAAAKTGLFKVIGKFGIFIFAGIAAVAVGVFKRLFRSRTTT